MTIGDVTANIVANTKGFQAGMNEVEGRIKKVGDGMVGFGKNMTKFVTLPILALGGGMIKSATDLESTEAKFNTVFEGMTDDATAFIEQFKELTPLTTAEARGVASGVQDLLVPMGFARENATELTGEFMPLIGALANFNNSTHTAAQVANAVSSALVGEYEPMRRLGVVTNKSAIDQRVLSSGMAETKDGITDQMRALALHEIITEGSADALAAYTEENLDTKTKMGLLKAEIIDVSAEFGETLLPMIEKVMDFFRGLSETLRELSPEQKEMIVKIMGIVAAVGPLILGVGKVIILLPKLAAGFALLSGPIGWIIALVAALITGIILLWKNNEGFRDDVVESWNTIKAKFQEFMESDFVKNAKRILVNTWNAIVEGAKSFQETFSQMWEIIKGIYEAHLKPALEELGGVFKEIFETGAEESVKFSEILKIVGKFIAYAIAGIVTALTLIITAIVKVMTWFGTLRANATEMFLAIWERVKESFNNVKAKFEEIATSIRTFWENKVSPILESLKKGFKAVGDFFGWVWSNILEPVIILMGAIIRRIVHEIAKVWNWLKDTVINPVMNWIKDKVEWATDKIQAAWERVKERTRTVWNWIKTNILNPIGGWLTDKVINPFSNVYEKIKEKMENVKNKVKEIWDSIKDFFNSRSEDMKNALVSPFTKAKNAIEGVAGFIKKSASRIDPRVKESPSLVENVERGVGQIIDAYQKLGDGINFNPVSKSMLQGGDVLNIAINLDGANITSPEIAGEYAERIGDAIIGKLREGRRSYG